MKNRITYFTIIIFAFLFCLDNDIKSQTTVKIGTQLWMNKNLDVSKYRNGEEIPHVHDALSWSTLTTGAWCYYANTSSNGTTYGKLYNWYAVNDSRGLAPEGFHIAKDSELNFLELNKSNEFASS